MNDRDGEVRKRDTGVQSRYRRVVPLDDFAKKYPCQDRAIQLQSRRDVQVIRQDDSPDTRGNMENGCAHGRFLLISEERVGSPEVDGLVSESLDTTTRADAVVVDADAGGVGICVEHLGVEGIWERCAGPGQFLDGRGTSLRTAAGSHKGDDQQYCQQYRNVLPVLHPDLRSFSGLVIGKTTCIYSIRCQVKRWYSSC
jgi:hypothetical protein